MALIRLINVTKTYRMGDVTVHALKGVSLTIEEGDFVAIMGPSGSGKSTLMNILGLLDVPSEGRYELGGTPVEKMSEDELAVLRRQTIGFVFQQFHLLPRMTALENAALPLLYSEKKLNLERSRELLERVGLGARVLHKTNELSGGQQQRVAIARSLVNQPRIIFADEPTGNLDTKSQNEIMATLRELNAQGITVILVTHEEEVAALAKRQIRMRDGQVQSDERREPFSSTIQATPEAKPSATLMTQAQGSRASEVLQHFQQGFRTLSANKVRTALSMLGILIGVAAVVAMLALGRGAQLEIESQLSSLGSNLLVLRAGSMRPGGVAIEAGSVSRLTVDDAQAISESIAGVNVSSPSVQGRGQVTFENKNWSTQVLGTRPDYARIHASEPVLGRFFDETEDRSRARVAVIGMTLVQELFPGRDPIGEMIKINKVSFQVIGVLPEKGSSGFRNQDDIVIIPVSTAMRRLLGRKYVDNIEIEVAQASELERVQNEAEDLMIKRHNVPPASQSEAFSVRNMADIQEALTSSSRTMSMLLASIAGISLLVGGIGIMNIMLVSVTERTREIGLRKAVGATRFDIMNQFMAESVVVSVVGGLCGIALGWGITLAMALLVGWTTAFSPASALLAFFFSASIGVIFGIYPATKAAALNPIEALRYE
jgi:macrolide transport system ATP-binding/permease protein